MEARDGNLKYSEGRGRRGRAGTRVNVVGSGRLGAVYSTDNSSLRYDRATPATNSIPNHSVASRNPRSRRKLNFEYLIKLTNDQVEPAEIIRCMNDPENDLPNILKENLSNFDYLETMLVVISRFCMKNGTSLFAEGFITVVKTLANQKTFTQITSIIINISKSSSTFLPKKEQRFKRLMKAISIIVTEMLVMMPSFGCDCLGRNFLSDVLFLKAMPSVKALNVDDSFDGIEDCIPLLETAFNHYVASKEVKIKEDAKEKCTEIDLDEPPDDFRTLKVVPSWEDVCVDVTPFLRPNIVKGSYPDVSTYLDIQFRLLREDFFHPLRLGLLSYRNPSQSKYKRGSDNIRLYHNVRILDYDMTKDYYTLQFSTERLQKINWKKSKRLIYGSLLLLTSNNFSNFHVFTVAERDDMRLAVGQIQVTYEGEKLTIRDRKQTFLMAESTIFFESYRSVLTALKNISPSHFPLLDYILGRNSETSIPKYLTQWAQPLYDLTWTDMISNFTKLNSATSLSNDVTATNLKSIKVSDDQNLIENPDEQHSPDEKTIEIQDGDLENLVSEVRRVPILNPNSRPDSFHLGMDPSQTAAFYAALSQQVSVIQGPPGTGKTYLGLRIVETLLKNRNSWMDEESVPILIICYTNHALDQFLEGILRFTQKVVRIGGQSKCEALESYSLNAWKKQSGRGGHYETKRWIFEIQDKLHELNRERQLINAVLHVLNTSGLIHQKVLSEMNIISESLCRKLDELLRPFNRLVILQNNWTPLAHWLSIYCNRTLGNLLDYFQRNNPVKNTNGRGPPLKPSSLKPESNNEQCWDKDHIANLEADRKVVEEDDDYLSDIKANKFFKESSELLRDVFVNFTYNFHEDEEKVKTMENFMEKLEGEDAAKLQMEIKELQKRMTLLRQLIDTVPPASPQQLKDWLARDLGKIPIAERWILYSSWRVKAVEILEEQAMKIEENFQQLTKRLKDVRHLESAEICKKSAIVGFTTTGAAKQRALLNHLNPKIVIVEEAGEVLEAHVVAALSSTCQQLILIGDHQQLRPPVETFHLVKEYNLDISLFERLIKNGMEPCVLGVQHRMRPEIAKLIVPSIYPSLENHPSVLKYPDVRGMSKNVFFLTHNEPEVSDRDAKSHLNPYEAELSLALARHLIIQGYSPSQITILTTYSGQLVHFWDIRDVGHFGCESIRISVVDNFQGEENDIILLSLVRSNEDDNIGFLRIENRICVALSRAKQGFYMIGNMGNLQGKSKLWNTISRDLDAMDQLGPDFPLKCQIHNNILKARQVTDFPPEGGCMEMCGVEMDCGHVCPKICHNSDREHTIIRCQKSCQRICRNGHVCPKLCSEPCKCVELVTKRLPCSHEQIVFCYLEPDEIDCQTLIYKKLPDCSHGMELPCGFKPEKATCPEMCDIELKCGHICPLKCHKESSHSKMKCDQPCQKTCPENHPCRKKCHENCDECSVVVVHALPCGHEKKAACFRDPQNIFCRVLVEKTLPDCQHTVKTECSRSTTGFKCEKRCEKMLCGDGHPCKKKCFQHCGPCLTEVTRTLECGHSLAMPCHTIPSPKMCRVPKESLLPPCGHLATIHCGGDPNKAHCSLPCNVRLDCGHTCTRKCHVNKDADHCDYQCKKPCERMKKGCKKEHRCGKKCFEECDPCTEKWERVLPCGHQKFTKCHLDDEDIFCSTLVTKIIEDCGHEIKLACSFQPSRAECNKICSRVLACGHVCRKNCSEPCNIEDCTEPVVTSNTNVCGHQVVMSCKNYRARGGIPSKQDLADHLRNCSHPCRSLLACEHHCSGTCGECFNGRVHRSCGQKCGRTLVCGHSCGVDCSASCPPCKMECEYFCAHSKCNRICGVPCTPCMEPCPWKCVHHSCTRKCGDTCDRPKCDEPCLKTLRCGHTCAGLCGEECPPLCRTCNRDELTEFILFGNEEDDDARFVFLPDCNHCIEVEGMDHWMSNDGNGEIKPKCCPKCKTPIRLCLRYGNIIKETFQDIAQVKKQIWLSKENPMQFFKSASEKLSQSRKLIHQIGSVKFPVVTAMEHQLGFIAEQLKPTKKNGKFVYPLLGSDGHFKIQVRLDVLIRLAESINLARCRSENLSKTHPQSSSLPSSNNASMSNAFLEEFCTIALKLLRSVTIRDRISFPEYQSVNQELERLDYLRAFFVLQSSQMFSVQGVGAAETKLIEDNLTWNVKVLDEYLKVELKKALESLGKKLKTGLGITDREKNEILKAMQLTQGHWYKCPNGHIYAIGQCGGAMEESRCNECGAVIGGTQHRLIAGNQVASEMDGAVRPAWPQ